MPTKLLTIRQLPEQGLKLSRSPVIRSPFGLIVRLPKNRVLRLPRIIKPPQKPKARTKASKDGRRHITRETKDYLRYQKSILDWAIRVTGSDKRDVSKRGFSEEAKEKLGCILTVDELMACEYDAPHRYGLTRLTRRSRAREYELKKAERQIKEWLEKEKKAHAAIPAAKENYEYAWRMFKTALTNHLEDHAANPIPGTHWETEETALGYAYEMRRKLSTYQKAFVKERVARAQNYKWRAIKGLLLWGGKQYTPYDSTFKEDRLLADFRERIRYGFGVADNTYLHSIGKEPEVKTVLSKENLPPTTEDVYALFEGRDVELPLSEKKKGQLSAMMEEINSLAAREEEIRGAMAPYTGEEKLTRESKRAILDYNATLARRNSLEAAAGLLLFLPKYYEPPNVLFNDPVFKALRDKIDKI
jgi:hypothetical protein